MVFNGFFFVFLKSAGRNFYYNYAEPFLCVFLLFNMYLICVSKIFSSLGILDSALIVEFYF